LTGDTFFSPVVIKQPGSTRSKSDRNANCPKHPERTRHSKIRYPFWFEIEELRAKYSLKAISKGVPSFESSDLLQLLKWEETAMSLQQWFSSSHYLVATPWNLSE
jgi:hypothetical protein